MKVHRIETADIIIYFCILVTAVGMFFPFLYVLSTSLMTTKEYLEGGMKLFPLQGITLDAYSSILRKSEIYICYKNTLLLVIGGTSLSLCLTTLTSYALSRKNLKGKRVFLFMFILTMLVNGGIIPNYIVVKSLGLMNSLSSMALPVAINTYFMIILRNYFLGIPESLEDSAYIDGCNEVGIMVKIFIPLSLPAMVTIGLFYAVNYWNSFFLGVMYLTDASKWPLQIYLRDLLIEAESTNSYMASTSSNIMWSVKMAAIIISIIPIICIYPFLQKYFSKGVMLGAVKG